MDTKKVRSATANAHPNISFIKYWGYSDIIKCFPNQYLFN